MSEPTERIGRDATVPAWGLPAVLTGFAALAVACAANKSLWLDEFHSLFHVRSEGPGEVLGKLRQDNHAPLYFLVLWATRAVFGEAQVVLRLPAILFGLGTLALSMRLARRVGGRDGALGGLGVPLVAGCSSLLLNVSAEMRMYSLLALAVTGLILAIVRGIQGERVFGSVALWTAVGLHTHYYFLHELAVLGLACGALAVLRPEVRRRALGILAGVLAAVVVAAPWYLWGFREQLLGGEMGPGVSEVSARRVVEAWMHLLYYNVSLGGAELRLVYLAGAGLSLLLAGAGLLRLWSRGRETALVLGAAAFGVPVWAALASQFSERSGFNWTYFAGSIAPLAVLVCASAWSPGRAGAAFRALVAFVAMSAAVLSARNAMSAGTEDFRGAVRHVVESAGPGDAVVVADWMPMLFPPDLSWKYYAPRVLEDTGGAELPDQLATTDAWDLADPAALERYERIFLINRGLPGTAPLLVHLGRGRTQAESKSFGYSPHVWRYDR